MDELKESVQLAVHEQKDPLLIYKFESFELFKKMLNKLNQEVVSFLIKGNFPNEKNTQIEEAKRAKRSNNYIESKEEMVNSAEIAANNKAVGANASQNNTKVETIVRKHPKIGRNNRITIKNNATGEEKTIKYKQAETSYKTR